MDIAFLCYGDLNQDSDYIILANKMLDSALIEMPQAKTVCMCRESDNAYLAVSDLKQTLPYRDDDYFGTYYARHLVGAHARGKDVCFADVDIVFNDDIEPLFNDKDFDVALTLRGDDDVLPKTKYIGGFMLSRNVDFWFEVSDAVNQMLPDLKKWIGIQFALEIVAPRYKVLELPASVYNYAPKSRNDPCEGAKVIHYRGNRKEWLLK